MCKDSGVPRFNPQYIDPDQFPAWDPWQLTSTKTNEPVKWPEVEYLLTNKNLWLVINGDNVLGLVDMKDQALIDRSTGEILHRNVKISDQYNSIIVEYSTNNKENTKNALVELIKKKDSTYSPLSLFFIIDNDLVLEQKKVNELFDTIIKDVSLEEEIKNLIIYKKALYNADNAEENQLLEILNPVINSKSIWKSHGLYLMAEYFYSKNEKQKSKEFFNQILSIENANQEIIKEAQKRLNRDLSE